MLKAGPLDDGHFIDVFVSSVQRHKVTRRMVRPGESSTLALDPFPAAKNLSVPLSKLIRKGMVLLSVVNPEQICLYFQAKIFLMPHSGVISLGYKVTIYIENIRQCGIILAIENKERIYENESALVSIKFVRRPEYIRNGYRFLLQQERTKAVGYVTRVF